MRTDIKFAGLSLSWTVEFAQSYCDKLTEMGFYCKVIDNLVAYSHRPFFRKEALEVLENITPKNNDS